MERPASVALTSTENILAIDASMLGTKPWSCIQSTRYDRLRPTATSMAVLANRYLTCGSSMSRPPLCFVALQNLTRSSKLRWAPAAPATFERSKSSVVVATYQPRFSSPNSESLGIRTLSK